jgi:hypothetical protein
MEDKAKLTQNTEEGAWRRIFMNTETHDAKETFEELLQDILSKENDNVKKAIVKEFKILYKTLRLNAAVNQQTVNQPLQEEEKHGGVALNVAPEGTQGNKSKLGYQNTTLGKRERPELNSQQKITQQNEEQNEQDDKGNGGNKRQRTSKDEPLGKHQGR